MNPSALTVAQTDVLHAVLDHCKLRHTEWVPVGEIFPVRNNQDNARRRVARNLGIAGTIATPGLEFSLHRGAFRFIAPAPSLEG